jgi:hypothetical protein
MLQRLGHLIITATEEQFQTRKQDQQTIIRKNKEMYRNYQNESMLHPAQLLLGCLYGWVGQGKRAQLRLCSFILLYPHHLLSPDRLVLTSGAALVITHEEWHDHPRTRPLSLGHN